MAHGTSAHIACYGIRRSGRRDDQTTNHRGRLNTTAGGSGRPRPRTCSRPELLLDDTALRDVLQHRGIVSDSCAPDPPRPLPQFPMWPSRRPPLPWPLLVSFSLEFGRDFSGIEGMPLRKNPPRCCCRCCCCRCCLGWCWSGCWFVALLDCAKLVVLLCFGVTGQAGSSSSGVEASLGNISTRLSTAAWDEHKQRKRLSLSWSI